MTNHSTLKKQKWMLLQAIFRDPKLSRYQIRLAGILLDFANPNSGDCFPGDAVLLKELGFSDARELRRCLRQLERDGWLRIQEDSAGRRKIIFNWKRAYVRLGKEAVAGTDTVSVAVADLDEAAESIWEQMPEVFPQNRNGHNWDKARPIFVELVRNGLDLDYFTSQVERYAEAREKQDPQYTKCIQNWLKDGDWKGTYGLTLMEKLRESQSKTQSDETKTRHPETNLCSCGAPLRCAPQEPAQAHYCDDCLASMTEDMEEERPWD